MSFYACMDTVAKALGRALTIDEFDALHEWLLAERDKAFAKGYPSDWLSAARTVAQQIEIEKAIAQRGLVRNRAVYADNKAFIALARQQVDGGRALQARLVGINTPIDGARLSVAAEAHGLWTNAGGTLLADLRRAGGGNRLVELFSTPSFELEIAKALRGETAHPDAVAIGQAIERTREDLRRQENDAGGWRGKLDGYVTRQSHDSLAVRRAGYEKWKAFILPRLDERTFDRQEELLAQLRQERSQVFQHRQEAVKEVVALQQQLDTIGELDKKATARGQRYDKQLGEVRSDFAGLVGRYLNAADGTPERTWLRTELDRLRGKMQTLATKGGDARRTLPGLIEDWNETLTLAERATTGVALLDELGGKLGAYDKRLKGAIDPDVLLRRVYDAISADTWMTGRGEEFRGLLSYLGPANIAKRRAAHRELHFKSAEDEVAYMRQFGAGGVADSVLREMEGAASAIALMRGLGVNPEAMFQRLRTDLLNEARETGNNALTRAVTRKSLDWQLAEVLGASRQVANPRLAGIAATVRSLQGMAKLGGAMLSSFGDVATAAAELRYQGRGGLSAYADMFAGLMKGRRSGERRIIADLLGVGFESLSGHIMSRLGGESAPPGGVAKAAALFFRLNGLSWWTDTHKITAGEVISRFYAASREQGFAELPKPNQRTLRQYGITPEHWDTMRKAAVNADERGIEFLTPEGIKGIALNHFMSAKELQVIDALQAVKDTKELQTLLDQLPTERQLGERRDRLASAYGALVTDRVDHAVVTPGARERAFVNMGTQRGDPLGEALRFVMQFKSFNIAMMTRSIGKELNGGGSKLSASMRVGFLAVQLGIFGYLAMSAKELLQGKNPRDPLAPETWAAALAQGGGMGILGDYAFGEFNRFGRSALATAAGPTLGNVDELLHLYATAKDPDVMRRGKWSSQVAAEGLRTLIANTPGASLFWLRPAINYLGVYPVQEMLAPGYLRRMESRVQRENKQTFWLSPQEAPRL